MHEFPLITTIALAFTAAWAFGLLARYLRLSPIVGYLLAGVLIGPHTPGFQGDVHLAQQLAEVGVILLMFGVGMHFRVAELLAVRSVAIPGALGQSVAATLVGVAAFAALGFDVASSAVMGMAIAVASTVVLMRVLSDADALSSPAGHVAVGWLLVEDVLTVVVLVLIPVFGNPPQSDSNWSIHPAIAVSWALLKLAALIALVLFAGSRIVPWALTQVARLRSQELFTLTVMVFSVAVAAGAYAAFGASMALGAFLAGMVVGQSPVGHQAAADALPLRDAFAVLFFVSVGMIFDPAFLIRDPWLLLAALGIVLVVKPLVALAIVAALGRSVRMSLTVALGLAQIGEFSFLLSQAARKVGLMPEEGANVLVGAAIVSIALNPMLFRSLDRVERWMRRRPRLWTLLNARAERRARVANAVHAGRIVAETKKREVAIVVGYGPVGQTADKLLREAGLATVIVDMNMDTISELRREGRIAIFGDASRPSILEGAGVAHASHLLLTLLQPSSRGGIIRTARSLNPKIKTFARARYLSERGDLQRLGATSAVFEEAEIAVGLARLVLLDRGEGRESIEQALRDIRLQLILDNAATLHTKTVCDVMIPWSRVQRLASSADLDDVRQAVRKRRFSRWPVVAPDSELPTGYLLAKDLIGFDAATSRWTDLLRPLQAIAPDVDVQSTLLRFQRSEGTLFVVSDGSSPLGIVTIEDVLERMIGRIEDEYPRRPSIRFAETVFVEEALLNLAGRTAEEAIAEMAAAVPRDRLPSHYDVGRLAIVRERELPTDQGAIALPHAPCPNLLSPVVLFGRSREGVLFRGEASGPVRLLFLLITPAERPDAYLYLLSQIATIGKSPDVMDRLMRAATAMEVESILSSVWIEKDEGV